MKLEVNRPTDRAIRYSLLPVKSSTKRRRFFRQPVFGSGYAGLGEYGSRIRRRHARTTGHVCPSRSSKEHEVRLLHYIEIRNFKHFGDKQRIELDHPAVLIGPNNCGKTTAIQAIALWSQAVKTWFEAKGKSTPRERTATSLNRLNIVSVPVQRTRYWHSRDMNRVDDEASVAVKDGSRANRMDEQQARPAAERT